MNGQGQGQGQQPASLHMRMEAAAMHVEQVELGAVGLDLGSMAPLAVDVLGMIAARVPDPVVKAVLNASVVVLRSFLSRTVGSAGPPEVFQ